MSVEPEPSSRHPHGAQMTRAGDRWNTVLTALLLLGVVVVGNRLASQHWIVRRDFSEDQLYTLGDATRSLLARLEDRLQVKAFFTGEILDGDAALGKARLEGQLDEFRALSGGFMSVDVVDPNVYGDALQEARQYGIRALPRVTRKGISAVSQDLFLGLVLRYRGREEVIPFAVPASFEGQFAKAVHGLLAERRPVVGWVGDEFGLDPDAELAAWGTHLTARSALSARYDIREVVRLRSGEPVAPDIDVLFVMRPRDLHPRAAYEIDQFVQRGGRLIVCVDLSELGLSEAQPYTIRSTELSGLEAVLQAYGVPPTPEHVWDDPWKLEFPVERVFNVGGERRTQTVGIPMPLWIQVREEGLAAELPVTAGLSGVALFAAQPIVPADSVTLAPGVERVDLLRSSDGAYRVDRVQRRLSLDPGEIQAQSESVHARGAGQSYTLAAYVSGPLPSPFAESGAPAPWNPLTEDEQASTDEPVLSAANRGEVVVFGDADWLRDGFFAPANRILLENLVDWLTLDSELIAVRSRVPKNRRLKDFVEEERLARDLVFGADADTLAERERMTRLEDEARRAATGRQWRAMLVPVLISLALLLAFGFLWNARERKQSASERESGAS